MFSSEKDNNVRKYQQVVLSNSLTALLRHQLVSKKVPQSFCGAYGHFSACTRTHTCVSFYTSCSFEESHGFHWSSKLNPVLGLLC